MTPTRDKTDGFGYIEDTEQSAMRCPSCGSTSSQIHNHDRLVMCDGCDRVGELSGTPEQPKVAWR